MNNILIPFDGSRDAYQALEVAKTLAVANKAKATVVHVISPGAPTATEREIIETEYADELVQRVKWPNLDPGNSTAYARTVFETQDNNNLAIKGILARVVAEQAAKILHDAGVTEINTLTKNGNVADEILTTAEEHHCDTIVMGTRGLSDIQGLLLGSSSHKVVRSAKCNVILVK